MMRMLAVPILALASCSGGQPAVSGSYDEAVRCIELTVLLSMVRSQVDEIASERGVTIVSKHLGAKWEAQAMERGTRDGLTSEQVDEDLRSAIGNASTALHTPFQAMPDPDDLTAEANEIFDEIYDCSEQAKSFALPEEVTQ